MVYSCNTRPCRSPIIFRVHSHSGTPALSHSSCSMHLPWHSLSVLAIACSAACAGEINPRCKRNANGLRYYSHMHSESMGGTLYIASRQDYWPSWRSIYAYRVGSLFSCLFCQRVQQVQRLTGLIYPLLCSTLQITILYPAAQQACATLNHNTSCSVLPAPNSLNCARVRSAETVAPMASQRTNSCTATSKSAHKSCIYAVPHLDSLHGFHHSVRVHVFSCTRREVFVARIASATAIVMSGSVLFVVAPSPRIQVIASMPRASAKSSNATNAMTSHADDSTAGRDGCRRNAAAAARTQPPFLGERCEATFDGAPQGSRVGASGATEHFAASDSASTSRLAPQPPPSFASAEMRCILASRP